jgi:transposase-like protein
MIFRCPRCDSPIVNEYFDTSGQHWHCNNCGRNSHSYTLVYDNQTQQLQELPYYADNKTNIRGGTK